MDSYVPPATISLFDFPFLVVLRVLEEAVSAAGFLESINLRLVCSTYKTRGSITSWINSGVEFFDSEVQRIVFIRSPLSIFTPMQFCQNFPIPLVSRIIFERVKFGKPKSSMLNLINSGLQCYLDGDESVDEQRRLQAISVLCDAVALRLSLGAILSRLKPDRDLDLTIVKDKSSLSIALVTAAGLGDVDRVQSLLNQGASLDLDHSLYGRPLLVAAYRGHFHMVSLLLELGAKPLLTIEKKLSDRMRPSTLCQAAYVRRMDILELLLNPKYHIDRASQLYRSSLFRVIKSGRVQEAKFLLDQCDDLGADILGGNAGLWSSCLQVAARYGKDEIVTIALRKIGSHNISICRKKRCTHCGIVGLALHAATRADRNSTSELILDYGNVTDEAFPERRRALAFAANQRYLTLLEGIISDGGDYPKLLQNYLLMACTDNDMDMLSFLVKEFPDAQYRKKGKKALRHAAENGYLEFATRLLELGTDPNVSSKRSRYSPIVQATRRGYTEVVEVLLKFGAHGVATHVASDDSDVESEP